MKQALILVICAWTTSACSFWFNASPPECDSSADCFDEEICDDGRCRTARSDEEQETFIEDASILDTGLDLGLELDAQTQTFDPEDAMLPDAANAMPPFPGSACFPEEMLPELQGEWRDPPLPFCTAWARGWIERQAEFNVLTYRAGPSEKTETMKIPEVMWQRPAFAGPNAYVAVLNAKDTEAINIYRHSLTGDSTEINTNKFISRSPLRQSHPVRGDGFTAFLEETADSRHRVYVQVDARADERSARGFPCERNGNLDDQGDLAAGGQWIAWLERTPSERCAHIVLSRAEDCKNYFNQVRWDLSGRLVRSSNEQSALHVTKSGLIWLEDNQPCRMNDALTGQTQTDIKIWPFSLRNKPDTLTVSPPLDGQPLDVASHPSHAYVAVVAWKRGPRQLYLLDLETRTAVKLDTQGVIAHPTVGERYIVWSEQSNTDGTWEIRYEPLP